jgi:hypothetical protein
MKKSKKSAEVADSLDFELPDWSGMDDTSVRISPEAAFRLCEHYPSMLRRVSRERPVDRAEMCSVEFVL